MFGRLSIMVVSGAIGLTLTGCAATSPTMRAQSPTASSNGWETSHNCESGMCDAGYAPDGMEYCPPSAMCPPGAACPPSGPCRSCRGCQSGAQCLNLPFHPVHRNFHTYDVPSNLTYPQEDIPPAMVQYPYFTTRGPTDFFME